MYCEFFDALAYNVNCQVYSVVWSENFKTFKHNFNHGFTLISSLCISSTLNSCNSKLNFPPKNSEIKKTSYILIIIDDWKNVNPWLTQIKQTGLLTKFVHQWSTGWVKKLRFASSFLNQYFFDEILVHCI